MLKMETIRGTFWLSVNHLTAKRDNWSSKYERTVMKSSYLADLFTAVEVNPKNIRGVGLVVGQFIKNVLLDCGLAEFRSARYFADYFLSSINQRNTLVKFVLGFRNVSALQGFQGCTTRLGHFTIETKLLLVSFLIQRVIVRLEAGLKLWTAKSDCAWSKLNWKPWSCELTVAKIAFYDVTFKTTTRSREREPPDFSQLLMKNKSESPPENTKRMNLHTTIRNILSWECLKSSYRREKTFPLIFKTRKNAFLIPSGIATEKLI